MMMPRHKIGVALAPGCIVAIGWTGERHDVPFDGDVHAAFAAIREVLGVPRAMVTVALVPPLVEVRRVTLPPLRDEERRRVLTRDAARYFVGVRDPQVVGSDLLVTGGTHPGRKPGVPGVHLLAAAASARLVEEIEAAVAATGWVLAGIVPAHAAWAAGADGEVVVHLPEATELLRVEGGRVIERRHLRPGPEVPSGAAVLDDALTRAARAAPRVAAPELCSDRRYAARARVARRVALGLAAAAAAFLSLAGALEYWGLVRELAAVQARRAAIAPEVAAAMRARDSLAALARNLSALRTLEATSPHWSAFLADLADYLPRDAHIVALRGTGDSVVVQGVARQAAGVFQALQQMPRVRGVRAEAPIRQNAAPDGTVREQFALGTRLTAARSGP